MQGFKRARRRQAAGFYFLFQVAAGGQGAGRRKSQRGYPSPSWTPLLLIWPGYHAPSLGEQGGQAQGRG